jgi:hypothetical protein
VYSSDVAQVNDGVSRLVEPLRDRGIEVEDDLLHPAVARGGAW